MRSFNNFLKEATETSASRQAKLLGLVGDGHGGWYDAKGKFVAKTEQGKLKFYGQGGAKQKMINLHQRKQQKHLHQPRNLNQYNSNKKNHKKLKRVKVLFLYLVDSIHQQSDTRNFYNLLKEKQKELTQT